MPTLDELWTWIYSPLHELVAERAGDRDKSWTDLRAYFLECAGLRESSDNPFVDDLLTQLEELSGSDREALLDSNDQMDVFAYAIAQRHADVPVIDDSGTETIRAVLGDDPMFADLAEDQLRQMLVEVRDAMGAQ